MTTKGKLITIEGSDASGKATQSQKLFERLVNEKYNVIKLTFPNYESDSSALVKMYLNGDFGSDPNDVSPYITSTFYAVDRYASYKTQWEKFYLNGGIIISDRYTTSNMVHQASKIKDLEEKEKFLDWLWNLEFKLYGLPIPDSVLFLDMPPEYSQKLMEKRENKFTGEKEKDIHERNFQYLYDSYDNANYLVNKYKWEKISCIENSRIKAIEDIHNDIYAALKLIIKK